MNSEQAEVLISNLADILEELRGLRSDFLEFTGNNVYKMSDVINDIGDRICGGSNGIGGADLNEISMAIASVEATLDLK